MQGTVRKVLLLGYLAVTGLAQNRDPCDESLIQARGFLTNHQFSEALRTLKTALDRCSRNPEVYELLGITYDIARDPSNAQAAFREAIKLASRVPRLHTGLAVSLLKSGRTQEALEEFNLALSIEPKNRDANGNLAVFHLRSRNYQAAVEAFRRGEIEHSNDAALLLALAETYLAMGQKAEAQRVASRILKLGGSDSRVRFSLGLMMARNGEYESAVKHFLAIPGPQRDFAVCFNLGQAYSKLNQFEEARAAYFEAIDLDQKDADVYFVVGLDYVASQQPHRALPWLMKAHRIKPGQLEILLSLISCMIQELYFETASQLIDQGLNRYPGVASLYALQGELLFRTKKLEAALSSYHKPEALKPSEATLYVAQARVYLDLNRKDEAHRALENALLIKPESHEANLQVGRLLVAVQDYAKALPYLMKAINSRDTYAQAAYDLSRVYLAQGKLVEARSLLERLVQLVPDNDEYHYELARLYRTEGRSAEAQSEMRVFEQIKQQKDGLKFLPSAIYPE
jgi:tetratricopeptide (TPR) repeat protein